MHYRSDSINITKAIEGLKNSFIVHSTDTLNSLSADATSDQHIQRVIDFKQRKGPFSIIINSIKDIHKYAEVSMDQLNIINQVLPGAFTVLLEAKKSDLSKLVAEDSSLIGIRIPHHKFTLDLIKEFKKPIITTSLNKTGETPISNLKKVAKIYPDILIFDDGKEMRSKGSTILDISSDEIKIVRHGDGEYKL